MADNFTCNLQAETWELLQQPCHNNLQFGLFVLFCDERDPVIKYSFHLIVPLEFLLGTFFRMGLLSSVDAAVGRLIFALVSIIASLSSFSFSLL